MQSSTTSLPRSATIEELSDHEVIELSRSWAAISDISHLIFTQKLIASVEEYFGSMSPEAQHYAEYLLLPVLGTVKHLISLDPFTGSTLNFAEIPHQINEGHTSGLAHSILDHAVEQAEKANEAFHIAMEATAHTHVASTTAFSIAAGVLAPTASFGVAAGAWGLVGVETYSAINKGKYYFSINSWFKHTIKTMERGEKKITKLIALKNQLEEKNVKLSQPESGNSNNTDNLSAQPKKIAGMIRKNQNKIAKIEKNIQKLEEIQQSQQKLAILIAKVKEKKDRDKGKDQPGIRQELLHRFKHIKMQRESRLNNINNDQVHDELKNSSLAKENIDLDNLDNELQPEEEALFDLLRKNKRDQFCNKLLAVLESSLVAAGLSLIAISTVSAHGAPAFAFAGMGLVSLGSLAMLAKKLIVSLNNKIASSVNNKKIRHKLNKEYQTLFEDPKHRVDVYIALLNLKNSQLSYSQQRNQERLNEAENEQRVFFLSPQEKAEFINEQVKFRLAFEYSYATALNNFNQLNQTDPNYDAEKSKMHALEKKYYSQLFLMHPKKRKIILKAAEKKAIRTQILANAVNRQAHAPHSTTQLTRNDPRLALISEKDQVKIINRENRHIYRVMLTDRSMQIVHTIAHAVKKTGQILADRLNAKNQDQENLAPPTPRN